MASIENRSRFVVSVKDNDKLTRYVPYNKLEAVEAKYFNERDRRLRDGEEARLRVALASPDLGRATESVLQDMANEALDGRHFTSGSDRKRQLAAVRAQLRAVAEAQADVIPYLQAFLLFQLMTGAGAARP